MKKLVQRTFAIAVTFMLVMPLTVFADTGYMKHGVGTEWQSEVIRFTNETHYPISLTWRQTDIPETPEHYRTWYMGGVIVFFANGLTTLTLVNDLWWADGGITLEWANHQILNEIILPSDLTLMEYLKPPYEFWTTNYYEGGREISQRWDAVERRPVHLNNLQLRELSDETREWLTDGHDFEIRDDHGEYVLAGAYVTLSEGIYAIRTSSYSNVPTFILVVGNADTSVLQTYNRQQMTAATRTLRFAIDNTTFMDNGTNRTLEAAPFIANDRTMVPLRAIIEAFGVTPQFNDGVIAFTIGGVNHTMTVGEPLPDNMGTPVIVADRTFVPLIFVINALDGANARWDADNRVAYVYIY